MDIRVLRYFLAVAREQSYSVAAERLYLSQPTLSRQLKELEEELGKTLLIRSNKGVTLTEEGMILRKRAEEIVELLDKAEQEVKNSLGISIKIAAEYNLVYNGSVMAAEGMGYCLCFDRLINTEGGNMCFKPIEPKIEAESTFVWKRYTVFTKAASLFLSQFRQDIDNYRE